MRSTVALALLLCALASGCASSGTQPAAPSRLTGVSLALQDMEGKPLDLEAELKAGRKVAFVFWQTNCPSCQREAPRIVKAQAELREQITFVGVVPGGAHNSVEKVRARRSEWGYEAFPQVLDETESFTQALKVNATPTVIVLGPGREILYRAHVAPKNWATLGAPQ